MGKVQHDLTDEQWAALMDAWAGCAYCGSPALASRRTACCPSRAAAATRSTNVVPACRSCNASKCNDEVTGWLRRKKLDERAFLVRHHELLNSLRERYAIRAGARVSRGSPATSYESWSLPLGSYDVPRLDNVIRCGRHRDRLV